MSSCDKNSTLGKVISSIATLRKGSLQVLSNQAISRQGC